MTCAFPICVNPGTLLYWSLTTNLLCRLYWTTQWILAFHFWLATFNFLFSRSWDVLFGALCIRNSMYITGCGKLWNEAINVLAKTSYSMICSNWITLWLWARKVSLISYPYCCILWMVFIYFLMTYFYFYYMNWGIFCLYCLICLELSTTNQINDSRTATLLKTVTSRLGMTCSIMNCLNKYTLCGWYNWTNLIYYAYQKAFWKVIICSLTTLSTLSNYESWSLPTCRSHTTNPRYRWICKLSMESNLQDLGFMGLLGLVYIMLLLPYD